MSPARDWRTGSCPSPSSPMRSCAECSLHLQPPPRRRGKASASKRTLRDFMTAQDFEFICKLLRERSAIALEAGKEYLVETRLAPIVRQRNLNSIADLIAQLRRQPGNGLDRQIVEALVTT